MSLMHVCAVCGTEFEPSGYQLVVNGRSYHSVDCAVRALEQAAAAHLEPLAFEDERPVNEEDPATSSGRVYSLSGAVVASARRSDSIAS